MAIDRRSFHRSLLAAAAVGASAALPAAPAWAKPDDDDDAAEGGMRTGKSITITNAAAGNELVITGRVGSAAPGVLGRLPTGGLGSGSGLGSQGAVKFSEDGRTLFAVNAGSNTVSVFEVRASRIALVSVHPSGGLHPISVSESGGLVYVLNDGGNGNVAGFRHHRGALTPVASGVQPLSVAGGAGPAQVGIGPDGDVLVVTEKNTNRVTSYALDRDGNAGAPHSIASSGATPFGFAFNRRNRLLVSEAVVSALSSYAFDRQAPSRPLLVSGSVPSGQGAACWAAVTPDGRWAYTGNAGTSNLSLYRIDNDGRAQLVQAAAGSTLGGGAGDISIAPHGRTLSVLAPRAPAVFSFAIADDGTLTPIGSVGGLPAGVVGMAAN